MRRMRAALSKVRRDPGSGSGAARLRLCADHTVQAGIPPHEDPVAGGGGGTRLWPLSSDRRPSSSLAPFETSVSSRDLCPGAPPFRDVWVATNDRYVELVRRELPQFPAERILPEPARRNSGPALLARLRFLEEGDPVTAVVPPTRPSRTRTPSAARSVLRRRRRSRIGRPAGVPPTRPDTDFGYLTVATQTGPSTSHRFRGEAGSRPSEQCVARETSATAGIFVFPALPLPRGGTTVAGSSFLRRTLPEGLRRGVQGEAATYTAPYLHLHRLRVIEKARGVLVVRDPRAGATSGLESRRQMPAPGLERELDPRGGTVLAPGCGHGGRRDPGGRPRPPLRAGSGAARSVEDLRRKAAEGKALNAEQSGMKTTSLRL